MWVLANGMRRAAKLSWAVKTLNTPRKPMMMTARYACIACLPLMPAVWQSVAAQPHRANDQAPHQGKQVQQGRPGQQPRAMPPGATHRPPPARDADTQRMHKNHPAAPPHMQHMPSPAPAVQIPIGRYFQDHHLAAAKNYYNLPENRGYCPPGLAKKGAGCLPPGQAKQWRKGEPLPRGVIYYDVPRSVVLALGVPPPGYKYVRMASDILLIAIGTSMVMDALEDLVH